MHMVVWNPIKSQFHVTTPGKYPGSILSSFHLYSPAPTLAGVGVARVRKVTVRVTESVVHRLRFVATQHFLAISTAKKGRESCFIFCLFSVFTWGEGKSRSCFTHKIWRYDVWIYQNHKDRDWARRETQDVFHSETNSPQNDRESWALIKGFRIPESSDLRRADMIRLRSVIGARTAIQNCFRISQACGSQTVACLCTTGGTSKQGKQLETVKMMLLWQTIVY